MFALQRYFVCWVARVGEEPLRPAPSEKRLSGLAVASFPATSESERSICFKQLYPKTGHRIKYAKGDTGTVDTTVARVWSAPP
jgi:hypothetical protein